MAVGGKSKGELFGVASLHQANFGAVCHVVIGRPSRRGEIRQSHPRSQLYHVAAEEGREKMTTKYGNRIY